MYKQATINVSTKGNLLFANSRITSTNINRIVLFDLSQLSVKFGHYAERLIIRKYLLKFAKSFVRDYLPSFGRDIGGIEMEGKDSIPFFHSVDNEVVLLLTRTLR